MERDSVADHTLHVANSPHRGRWGHVTERVVSTVGSLVQGPTEGEEEMVTLGGGA